MGKSNNPAKRAEQEKVLKAKKARRAKNGAGFMKFVFVAVLIIAVCGPFFAGLTNLSVAPTPVAPATIPATAPATIPVPAAVAPAITDAPAAPAPAAPAGQ